MTARHAAEDLAAAIVSTACRILPRAAARWLGRGIGRALAGVDARHRGIAVENLARAFPAWNAERCERVARAVYAHFGQILMDIFWFGHRQREDVLAQVRVVGRENLESAKASGRGIVLVTAHIGNWELHGLVHGWIAGPIQVLARPLDNPLLDRRLCEFRKRGGNGVIYKRKALAQTLRALREGGSVAFLIDQNVQEKDGIFVEFFGRPAATTTVAAALAVKTGGPILACRAVLESDGSYRLVYEPPVYAREAADRQDEIKRLTQALTTTIEAWVRETPEQWLWIHRRWKTQPLHASTTDAH